MKLIRRLLVLMIFLTALPVSAVQAEGGIAIQPYWTFPTDAPVTHIQTGDINGDGTPEVVMTTSDNWVYVVENDGDLAWRYELETQATTLLVADMDGDGQIAEIWVGGKDRDVLLSATEKPVWRMIHEAYEGTDLITLAVFAADLDGDGRRELVVGDTTALSIEDSETGTLRSIVFQQPQIDVWAGEADGDDRLELVSGSVGGNLVYVLNDDFSWVWQQPIEGEVRLVQGGDVDGDGLAEIVALSASWDLFFLESDGRQVWHHEMSVENDASPPLPGQLMIRDLEGDGRMEIIVLAPAGVHVFKGDGSQVWQHPLSLAPDRSALSQNSEGFVTAEALESGFQSRLQAADINGDGQAEIAVATGGQGPVYLLAANGQRLAEYLTGKNTGGLAYTDLNGDGQGEIMVGTETGLQVFGAARPAKRRELWQSPFLDRVTALELTDLDGDGRSEVVAGSKEGQVSALAGDGHILWQVNFSPENSDTFTSGSLTVLALSAGDVDGDGFSEVVANAQGSQIYLLDSSGPRWVVPAEGKFITSVAVHDLDGDGRAEIILGGDSLLGSASVVRLLDGDGKQIWEWNLTGGVTAVAGDGEDILVGTGSGQVYRLTATGAPGGEYEMGARVLSFGSGQAITENGRVYRLDEAEATLVRDLGASPRIARLNTETAAFIMGEQAVSLISGDGLPWQTTVDSRVLSLTVGDLNGDGEAEVAVGTDNGRVHLFGLVVNQPPLLTKPTLAETRTGYAYGIDVNDPDGDTVTVTVEIWDPSAGVWLTGATHSFSQEQGQLNLEVAEPFDTWDSGQESRFRFRYDDGHNQGTLKEVAGPFTIPTLPWYTYYGQWVGLGALLLLPVALGLVFYRRQRVYRRSPVGRAESLLKQLRTHPDEALPRLRDLARDDPALLVYLPSLAREAREAVIADLSEGFNLILIRPEVAVEGVRVIVTRGGEEARTRRGAGEQGSRGAGEPGVQSEALPESGGAALRQAQEPGQGSRGDEPEDLIVNRKSEIVNLYGLCLEALEANSVSRIVSLQAHLAEQKDSSVVTTSVEESSWDRLSSLSGADWKVCSTALAELSRVAQTLRNYERVETVEDKIAYLAQTIETLGRLDREFQATLPQPERNIFSRIAFNWLMVTTNALEDLQGRAQIEASLKTRQVLNLEQATLSLELTNTGRSPASNLTVSLVSDQLYAVGNGGAQLDILPAGRSVVVELPLSAAPSVEQFRAEFAITFDDRERNGKRVAFADLVRLLKPATTFRPIPNPYAPGTPLRPSSPIFFGRDDLFQFIAENLGGATRQNILVLIGQRRMGKTSFLQQLPARLGQAYLPVYLDGQSLGIDPGMANFFYDLSLAIADALADQGCAVTEPVLADFQERPSGVFERTFLPAVFEVIGSRRLLLLFDEFEELEMRVASGKLEATIFPFFRHLMQHADKLGFVFVGTHRLEELTTDYWSILFNIALYKHVTFLSEGAAKALIVEPVAQHGLLYDDLALDKIIRVTAGQPYFLQLICHALVNRANREGRGYLTVRDVNDTLAELVELGEAHFAFLWEQSSPAEQLVLAALMRLLARTSTVTATQIVELLVERGRPLELQVVREALRRLTERDIVRELGESPPRYEYKVDLVRLWVERYKALGRVIEG
ncbi:MAG: hypothetical protein DPW09_39375, partial [Anaerolineae bacterium]|nr:hypothetical protein [Anaerolineae bacterium]